MYKVRAVISERGIVRDGPTRQSETLDAARGEANDLLVQIMRDNPCMGRDAASTAECRGHGKFGSCGMRVHVRIERV